MDYKFSVSKIKLTALESVYTKTIETTSGVEIAYDVTTSRVSNPDGIAIEEWKDEEKISITLDYVDDIDTTLIAGGRYDIELTTGAEGGGITFTLGNCRLVGYTVRTLQGQFIAISARFTKIGSAASSTGTLQKVKFGSIYLGDTAYVTCTYQGNVITRIIPTALGTIFQPTSQTGGGLTTIRVKARVRKDTRLELEQYVNSLLNSLSTGKATLTVEYGATSYTLTNCVFTSGAMQDINRNFADIDFEFLRSAY